MEKTYCLNLVGMDAQIQVHQSLKTLLALPDYYGNNLDALYDSLCSRTDPCELWLLGMEKAPDLIKRLAKGVEAVFMDAGHTVLRVD